MKQGDDPDFPAQGRREDEPHWYTWTAHKDPRVFYVPKRKSEEAVCSHARRCPADADGVTALELISTAADQLPPQEGQQSALGRRPVSAAP